MAATPEELKGMAGHVSYEVDEFRKAVQMLSKLNNAELEWNATLESVLLHFRILRDFFISEGRGDDMCARHYVSDWAPTRDPCVCRNKGGY